MVIEEARSGSSGPERVLRAKRGYSFLEVRLCYNRHPMFVSHRKSGLVAYDDTDLPIRLDDGSM